MGGRPHSQTHVLTPLFTLVMDSAGIEPTDHDLEQVAIQFGQGDGHTLLMEAEHAADSTIDVLLDEAGGACVGLLEALALVLDAVTQCPQFGGDLVEGASP